MKKISVIIGLIAALFFAFGFGVGKYDSANTGDSEGEKIYSLEEVLSDEFYSASFDVEEKRLEIGTNIPDVMGLLTVPISKEDEQRLIEEIEKWKLTLPPPNDFENDLLPRFPLLQSNYSIKLTLNTGYRFQVNSIEKSFYFDNGLDDMKIYKIENGELFFDLLDKIEKNATYKK